jgi:hypothetical protein
VCIINQTRKNTKYCNNWISHISLIEHLELYYDFLLDREILGRRLSFEGPPVLIDYILQEEVVVVTWLRVLFQRSQFIVINVTQKKKKENLKIFIFIKQCNNTIVIHVLLVNTKCNIYIQMQFMCVRHKTKERLRKTFLSPSF